MSWQFDGRPKKTIGHLLHTMSSFVHHFKAIGEFKLELIVRKRSIWVKISDFLSPVTLKFYRWPWKTRGHIFYTSTTSSLVHYFIAICEFKMELVRKRSIWVKIGDFLSCVTLKFDGWPWKTIGHLFYAISSFVHHFILTICEFKMELQFGNAKFGLKSTIFCPVSPWKLTDDLEKQQGASSMLLQALCIIS